MRSRYSAFVLGLGEYLVHSWHPAHLGGLTAEELSHIDTRWDGLEIIASQGGPEDETGMVEFKAWFLEGDERHCLHERSRFVRYQGRWVYTEGEQDPAPRKPAATIPAPVAAAKSTRSAAADASHPHQTRQTVTRGIRCPFFVPVIRHQPTNRCDNKRDKCHIMLINARANERLRAQIWPISNISTQK